MADQNKRIEERARELISRITEAFDTGCRIFDSKGKELKTVREVVDCLGKRGRIEVFDSDEEANEYICKKN